MRISSEVIPRRAVLAALPRNSNDRFGAMEREASADASPPASRSPTIPRRSTPEAGGKVDKKNPTQFGRALTHMDVEMIAAYSPEARGRSVRFFRTNQERLVKELVLYGITTMEEANRYLREKYLPAFNKEFMVEPAEPGTAFVTWVGPALDDILCEQHQRTVGNDNCVSFDGLKLQIPQDKHRCHYVKAKVRVLRHADGSLSVLHGPRKLETYDQTGNPLGKTLRATA